jgi:hypothetical protein
MKGRRQGPSPYEVRSVLSPADSRKRNIFLKTTGRLSEDLLFGGCWKMFRCKASEVLRNEAYLAVRRSDEE